jgi:hypothetical protein
MILKLFLKIITLLHILFILYVTLIPFSNNERLKLLHITIIPFIILHWVLNNNTCCLTLTEQHLRKKIMKDNYNEEDCITCKLINPVYDFKNNYKKHVFFIYFITIILWLINIVDLYNQDKLKNFKLLFKLKKCFH